MTRDPYFDSVATSADAVKNVLRLNEAISEVVYNADKSGLPVHLDLDDASIASVGSLLGITPQEFRDQLVSAVGRVRKRGDLVGIFAEFDQATSKWEAIGNYLATPPALSLLAVLSIAADEMSAEGDIGANNYYARLSQVLTRGGGTAPNQNTLAKEYRKHAVKLWTSLNRWLEEWQGARGTPTVPVPVPGSENDPHKYIRMPISQALLRESDRRNLYRMFSANNLDPAMRVSVELMFILLEQWAISPFATQQLKKLWKNEDYRESLVLMVIAALDAWPGAEEEVDGEPTTRSKVGLTLVLDKWMHQAEFGVEIRYIGLEEPNEVKIRTADGSFSKSMVVPAGPKSIRIADLSAFDTPSLIDGIIDVQDEQVGLKGQRRPRAIVPMMFQQASNEYIEVAGVAMGSVYGLLVRRSTESVSDLDTKVRDLLDDVARPGWTEVDRSRFAGLPDEWTLFQNVNIVVPFDRRSLTHLVLEVLVPLEASSIQFSNGFEIPGRRERWLRSAPPELLAVVPRDTRVEMSIMNGSGDMVAKAGPFPRASLIDLKNCGLPTGSYVAIVSSDDGETIQRRFALVDAETPNPTAMRRQGRLGHLLHPDSGFASVSAAQIDDPDQVIALQGLRHPSLSGQDLLASVSDVPSTAQWRMNAATPLRSSVAKTSMAQAPKEACVRSGAHTIVLPTFYGKLGTGFIEGVCRFCGLTRKLPARGRPRRTVLQKKPAAVPSARAIKDMGPFVRAIPKNEIQELGAWDDLFEALCYLRQGSVADLEAVSARLSGGSVGVERLVRYLSALGHIDVAMNDRVRPLQWAISPAVIVVTSKTKAHLAGFRSSELLSKMEKCIVPHRGMIKRYEIPKAPSSVSIEFPAGIEVDFDTVFDGVLDPITQQQIQVSRSSCRAILQQCAPISKVIEDSPKVQRPNSTQVNIWRPDIAGWERTSSSNMPGAFQHIGHGYYYTFNHSEIGLGDLTTAGSPSTVKHNASRLAGIPLVFYSPYTRVLVARLGAELPPVMNRALTSLTGQLPDEDEANLCVSYHDVPLDVAQFVHFLLTN